MHYFSITELLVKLNGGNSGHYKSIHIKANITMLLLLDLFNDIGLIRGYHKIDNSSFVEVFFKYANSVAVFKRIVQISKPSKRVYVDLIKMKKLKERGGKIIYVISTSKGYFIDTDCLIKNHGGEVVLKIIL